MDAGTDEMEGGRKRAVRWLGFIRLIFVDGEHLS